MDDVCLSTVHVAKPSNKRQMVLKRRQRRFIYTVTNLNDEPIYVLMTSNETGVRSAALSHNPYLRRFIRDQTQQGWKINEHLKLVDGCPHGVPSERADAFKCFFVTEYDTIYRHNDGVWNGRCNLRHGPNLFNHDGEFEQIRTELGMGDIEVDYNVKEEDTVLHGAVASVLSDVMEETADEKTDVPLEEVADAFSMARKYVLVLKGKSLATDKAERLIAYYDKIFARGKKQTLTLKYADFMQEWNNIDNIVQADFKINKSAMSQSETLACRSVLAHGKCVKVFFHNGEDARIEGLEPLTYQNFMPLLKTLLYLLKQMDGLSCHTFKSKMAWTQATFLVGKGSDKVPQGRVKALERVCTLLGESWLTEEQRTLAEKRKKELLSTD